MATRDVEDLDFDVHDLTGQMNIVTDLSDEESIHDSDVEAQEEEANADDDYDTESESELLTESDTDDDDSEMHEAAEGETDSDDEPDKDLDNPNIPDHDPIHCDDIDDSDDEDDADADAETQVSQRKKATPKRWLSEVQYYQSTTHLLIPKAPFRRLVREIAQDYNTDLEFTSESFDALQTASEDYLTTRFYEAQLVAIHASRQTVQPNDIQMVRHIHDERA